MNFYKTSFLVGTYTAINLVVGLIVVKVNAKIIGPEGIALLGQYTNITSIIGILASGSIATGIIKYVSEYKENPLKLKSYISTALGISILCSLFFSVLVLLNSKWLGLKAFRTHVELYSIFIYYGFFLIVNTTNLVFNAILNGLSEIKKMTYINIITSIANLVTTIYCAHTWGIYGCFMAGIIVGLINLSISLIFIRKLMFFSWNIFLIKIDKEILKKYGKFTLMTIVAVVTPFVLIKIRSSIITDLGEQKAGFWQTITKFSELYIGFITTILSVYFLPKLTSVFNDKQKLGEEIYKGYFRVIPALIILSIVLWMLRDLILKILFTPQFLPTRDLFIYFLIGNVFKVSAWIIGNLFYVKELTKSTIVFWIVFELSYLFLGKYFLMIYGLEGVGIAFLVNMILYFITTAIIFKKELYLGYKYAINKTN